MTQRDAATQTRPAWMDWLLLGLLVFVTRLLFFGIGSPWIDEINNWQIAEENGLTPRAAGSHRLTYLSISAGIAILDSTWGLRLYSSLFGAATVVTVFIWLRRRLSPGEAWLPTLLLLFSPFAIYYSHDANHYAPTILGGAVAVMAFDHVMRRGLHGFPGWGVALAVNLIAYLYHPIAVFPFAATLFAPLAWLLLHPEAIGPRSIPPSRKRIVMLLMGILVCAVLANYLLGRYGANIEIPPDHSRRFGLNWDFVSALSASFFISIFVYTMPHLLLGMAALALCGAGFWVGIRDQRTRWIAVGCILVAAATMGPYCIVSVRQSFSPRYVAPALVPMLLGIALFLGWLWRQGGFHRILVYTWMALVILSTVNWERKRLSGSFQPSYEAMEWIIANTPDDAVIVTANRFQSMSIRFLWNRFPMGNREHLPLSFQSVSFTLPARQAVERVHTDPREHYLIWIPGLEHLTFGATAWIESGVETVAALESWSRDPFVPIVRDVHIGRIKKPQANPFHLPLSGSAASTVYTETNPVSHGSFTGGMMRYQGIGGARYTFETDQPLENLFLEVRFTSQTARPSQVILLLNDHELWWAPTGEGPAATALRLPRQIPAARHTIDVILPAFAGAEARQQTMVLDRLSSQTSLEEIHDCFPLAPLATYGPAVSISPPLTDMPVPAQSIRIPKLSSMLADQAIAVLLQRIEVTGLGDRKLSTELTRVQSGGRIQAGPTVNWLYGHGYRALIVPERWIGEDLELRNSLVASPDFRPRNYTAEIGPAMLYQAPTSPGP